MYVGMPILEIEVGLLCSLLLYNDVYIEVSDILSPSDFYSDRHKIIYKAISESIDGNEPIDAAILAEKLKNNNLLEKAGNVSYIAEIIDYPLAINPEYYAKTIKEKSNVRQLQLVLNEGMKLCNNVNGNASDVINDIQTKINSIGLDGKQTSKNYTDISEISIDRYGERYKNRGDVTGIPSGFYDLDRLTSGFQKTDFIIIAARPSMGKTAFACNLSKYAGYKGHSILINSLEMSHEQWFDRDVAALTEIDTTKFRSGMFTQDEIERTPDALSKLHNLKIWIDDQGGLHYQDVIRRARKQHKKYGLDLLIVDYLQLLSGDTKNNRVAEITEISKSLKNLAKELHIPVIALSQLNRSLESRADKRPILSDLRDSGTLEQDADIVLFIYRDSVYTKNESDNTAEIIIAKNRNGRANLFVKLLFEKKYTRFMNLAKR